jgi:hypothetical protein
MIEEAIQKSIFSGKTEKTFIDKLLAKEEVQKVRNIIKKDKLSRSDLLELLDLMSGTEKKLLNYSSWDRYVIQKYFVWIRDFVALAEMFYDYEEFLKEKKINLSPEGKKVYSNIMRQIQHSIKFLVDLYFNIERSTLSLGGSGFFEILKNKFEIDYPHVTAAAQQEKSGGFKIFGGSKK